MTHTTTDAAEARARAAFRTIFNTASGTVRTKADAETALSLIAGMAEKALATAEAASGAGERRFKATGDEMTDRLQTALFHSCGEITSEMASAIASNLSEQLRDGDEDWGLRLSLFPDDAASLPPATDPAMAEAIPGTNDSCRAVANWSDDAVEQLVHELSFELEDAALDANDYVTVNRAKLTVIAKRIVARAALAAAPTIPATGEAIPEGMKPWHGGNGPPNDWDGGEVLLENEQMGDGNVWDHHPSRSPSRIVAYTPKASIPATGHASTVDPDDLRPWGYAPGEYLFRCIDCPPDRQIVTRTIGDKRSWRCKPHAEAARDASGHAATEGEGA